jgi:hypothetical protein
MGLSDFHQYFCFGILLTSNKRKKKPLILYPYFIGIITYCLVLHFAYALTSTISEKGTRHSRMTKL